MNVTRRNFYVIKFLERPFQGINEYVVVPHSWFKYDNIKIEALAVVFYPNESPSFTSIRVENQESLDGLECQHYVVVVKYATNDYEDANSYIKDIMTSCSENSHRSKTDNIVAIEDTENITTTPIKHHNVTPENARPKMNYPDDTYKVIKENLLQILETNIPSQEFEEYTPNTVPCDMELENEILPRGPLITSIWGNATDLYKHEEDQTKNTIPKRKSAVDLDHEIVFNFNGRPTPSNIPYIPEIPLKYRRLEPEQTNTLKVLSPNELNHRFSENTLQNSAKINESKTVHGIKSNIEILRFPNSYRELAMENSAIPSPKDFDKKTPTYFNGLIQHAPKIMTIDKQYIRLCNNEESIQNKSPELFLQTNERSNFSNGLVEHSPTVELHNKQNHTHLDKGAVISSNIPKRMPLNTAMPLLNNRRMESSMQISPLECHNYQNTKNPELDQSHTCSDIPEELKRMELNNSLNARNKNNIQMPQWKEPDSYCLTLKMSSHIPEILIQPQHIQEANLRLPVPDNFAKNVATSSTEDTVHAFHVPEKVVCKNNKELIELKQTLTLLTEFTSKTQARKSFDGSSGLKANIPTTLTSKNEIEKSFNGENELRNNIPTACTPKNVTRESIIDNRYTRHKIPTKFTSNTEARKLFEGNSGLKANIPTTSTSKYDAEKPFNGENESRNKTPAAFRSKDVTRESIIDNSDSRHKIPTKFTSNTEARKSFDGSSGLKANIPTTSTSKHEAEKPFNSENDPINNIPTAFTLKDVTRKSIIDNRDSRHKTPTVFTEARKLFNGSSDLKANIPTTSTSKYDAEKPFNVENVSGNKTPAAFRSKDVTRESIIDNSDTRYKIPTEFTSNTKARKSFDGSNDLKSNIPTTSIKKHGAEKPFDSENEPRNNMPTIFRSKNVTRESIIDNSDSRHKIPTKFTSNTEARKSFDGSSGLKANIPTTSTSKHEAEKPFNSENDPINNIPTAFTSKDVTRKSIIDNRDSRHKTPTIFTSNTEVRKLFNGSSGLKANIPTTSTSKHEANEPNAFTSKNMTRELKNDRRDSNKNIPKASTSNEAAGEIQKKCEEDNRADSSSHNRILADKRHPTSTEKEKTDRNIKRSDDVELPQSTSEHNRQITRNQQIMQHEYEANYFFSKMLVDMMNLSDNSEIIRKFRNIMNKYI